ncbi:unnamed protein product [Lactuca saligna]|uniref:Uncharacterized protein n=1 Tax=Lactuca saligna TaxID=75948 RepID=A0AA35UXL7_LACSI|nr:unnamed protein product [Lactuca saligna]
MSEIRMRELAGLLLVEGGNVGSSGLASPSQPAVGVVSPVRSPVSAPSGFPVGVQAGRGQSSARMASVLCYAIAQTSALMVATADQVYFVGANERQLKVLQGALAGILDEVLDSKVEHQVLAEQNCIMACEKDDLEDQVVTLEDRSKRLED